MTPRWFREASAKYEKWRDAALAELDEIEREADRAYMETRDDRFMDVILRCQAKRFQLTGDNPYGLDT